MIQRLDERSIARQIVAHEPRHVGAKIAAGSERKSGQQAARQHATSRDSDSQLAKGGEDAPFRSAANQRVFDLQIADGVHRMRATNGFVPTSERPMARM
jgi:hypothetical protein